MGTVLRVRGLRHRRGGREVLAVDELDLGPGSAWPCSVRTAPVRPRCCDCSPRSSGRRRAPSRSTASARRRWCVASPPHRLRDAAPRTPIHQRDQERRVTARWRGVERRDAATRGSGRPRASRRRAPCRPQGAFAVGRGGAEGQPGARPRSRAAVLLLDEPAAGLDAQARKAFLDDLAPRSTTARPRWCTYRTKRRRRSAWRTAWRFWWTAQSPARRAGGVVQQPADATVARLVGYDNVLPARIDGSRRVHFGGAPCGLVATTAPGPATVAAWGARSASAGRWARRLWPRSSGSPPDRAAGTWSYSLARCYEPTCHWTLHHPEPAKSSP